MPEHSSRMSRGVGPVFTLVAKWALLATLDVPAGVLRWITALGRLAATSGALSAICLRQLVLQILDPLILLALTPTDAVGPLQGPSSRLNGFHF